MRIIANKALLEFSALHPLALQPLQAWRRLIEARSYAIFAELKATFNSVDRVASYYVFDIGGNKYRIVAAIHFNQQRMFIRHVFTHKEYNQWKP